MTEATGVVNHATVAPITNVARCQQSLSNAMLRKGHLPGMVVFYGPSGWGKSTAASFVANKTRAYYVAAKSSWTRKAFLWSILKEMGIEPAKTLYEMTDQVAEQLVLSDRPLIVDEMDHIVEKNATEVVRDIYEGSNAAILLIGEERLPDKLKRWERFHGRVLDWSPAQPASIDDARHLVNLYSKNVTLDDDLLGHLVGLSHGSVRRICVNLDRILRQAQADGWEHVDLMTWEDRPLYTGEAPRRRVA